jgi:hypothetical protein
MADATKQLNYDPDAAFENLLANGGPDVGELLDERLLRKWGWNQRWRGDSGATDADASIASLDNPNEQRRLMTSANTIANTARDKLALQEYDGAIAELWMSIYHERVIGSPFRLANDSAYFLRGNLMEARAALNESLRLYTVGNSASGAAKTYYWLSQWELSQKNVVRAYEFARRSVLLFEKHQHKFTGMARTLLQEIGARIVRIR